MSEKAPMPNDRVTLDVGTILHTVEGRPFIKQLNSVSTVFSMKDTKVEFSGEELVKTGYVDDCKSVQLFKCSNGYFIFCNKTFSNNNWSAAGETLEDVLARLDSPEIKNKIITATGEKND